MAKAGADRRRSTRSHALALVAIVAVALGLRLHGLDARTLTHAEVYVPRLEMPGYVSTPPPRPTLAATLAGTLHHDNHPPGYYAFMWGWTGLAGTSLFALRLPSALAGAATVALLFFLVRRRDGDGVALATAALLALHGHHVFWSQQARMWVFLGLLAVLSVMLLDALHRRFRARTALAYVAVVTAGLWFEYSFWPFFAAQVLFEVFRSSESSRMPATIDLQLAALLLSAPVLYFLKVHLAQGRTVYLARTGVLEHLGGFLMLQWWLRGPVPPEKLGALASIGVVLLLAAAAALLFAGVMRARVATAANATPPVDGALPGSRAPIPAKAWPRVSRGFRALRTNAFMRRATDDPATVHVLVPVTILLFGALFVPSVAARSLLFVTPFALWLVVRGLFGWLRPPWLRAAAVAGMLAIGVVSVRQYAAPWAGQHDYQGLAAAMRPQLAADDLILINDDWRTQPMHYYLPPSRYRTGDFGPHLRGFADASISRPGRVWVLVFSAADVAAFERLAPQLRGYRERERIDASGAYALLLERDPAASSGPE